MARRPLALPPAAIDRWCQYAQGEVSHIAEATGFVNFELSYDGKNQCRVISPQHYIITFANRDKGRARYHSSFMTMRLAAEDTLPEQVQIGIEVRGRDGESVVCGGEYVEFELLSLVNDASKQPPLLIAAGPVRMNPESQQREFMRIDLGRCVRQIVTDIIDDPKHKGQKLVRSRWWICVEVLRLVCSANSLDCSALDTADAAPLEWVICLVDEKSTASTGSEQKSIDELAKFIDGGQGKKKARKKKKGKGDLGADDEPDDAADAEDMHPDMAMANAVKQSRPSANARLGQAASVSQATVTSSMQRASPLASGNVGPPPSRPAPPPGWSRTVDLAPTLVDIWRDCAGSDVRHIAESTGFVHFSLSFSRETRRRLISPTHYVIAFPHGVGQPRYHSALLTLSLVPDSEIPEDAQNVPACLRQQSTEALNYIEFRLLAREQEAPTLTPLRFRAGPVRINKNTEQRESMRLDLGEHIRWASPDLVEAAINGQPTRLVRQRWWLSIETLRLVCMANQLDCLGLDEPGHCPIEWVACLVDDRLPETSRAADEVDSTNSNRTAPRGGFDNSLANAAGRHSLGAGGSAEVCKAKSKKKKGSDAVEAASNTTAPVPKAAAAKASGKLHSTPAAPAAAKAKPKAKPSAPPVEEATSESEATQDEEEDGVEFSKAMEQQKLQPEAKRPDAASGKVPPSSRTLALPSALIDSWCHFARKTVTHVAEATGFVHFELSFDSERNRRTVSPEHYIIAFPNRDRGRARYHSSLLTLRIVSESDVPEDAVMRPQSDTAVEGDIEYVEFELLIRVHEAPVQQQLRVTAGPVRFNAQTGQRESMRIDLGGCVRQIATDIVDDPRGKRVVRNRWWVCIEMLRLVCTANSLDCQALDKPGHPPVEWVVCLVDERGTKAGKTSQPEEERNIDDLCDFIDGKAGNSKKKKKKKPKEKEDSFSEAVPRTLPMREVPELLKTAVPPPPPSTMSASQAAAAALSQVAASVAAGSGVKSSGMVPPAGSLGLTGSGARVDPVVQAQAAAQLLAEAVASCTSPQQAAAASAAAEAARRAVEAAAAPRHAATGLGGGYPSMPPGRAAADLLRAAEGGLRASQAGAQANSQANAGARQDSRSHPHWEPTPLPDDFEDAGEDWPPGVGGLGASSGFGLQPHSERLGRAFDGLESLLAGLRSEFSEDSRAAKSYEMNPSFMRNNLS
jgi:hypothetical protein